MGSLGGYVLVGFRRRVGDDGREPPRYTGAGRARGAWTVVPLLIVAVLFLVTARYIYGIEGHRLSAEALEVTVVGHQR